MLFNTMGYWWDIILNFEMPNCKLNKNLFIRKHDIRFHFLCEESFCELSRRSISKPFLLMFRTDTFHVNRSKNVLMT